MTTTDAPIGRVTERPYSVNDDRTLTVRLADMPRMPDGQGREYVPDTAVITYHREGNRDWLVHVRLIGFRVLSTGVMSPRSRAQRTYFDDAEVDSKYPTRRPIPPVLRETILNYHPDLDPEVVHA